MIGGDETIGGYDEGGWLTPGNVVAVNTQPKPVPVWTAEQLARALAWIKAHYGKPEFRCPEQPDQD